MTMYRPADVKGLKPSFYSCVEFQEKVNELGSLGNHWFLNAIFVNNLLLCTLINVKTQYMIYMNLKLKWFSFIIL